MENGAIFHPDHIPLAELVVAPVRSSPPASDEALSLLDLPGGVLAHLLESMLASPGHVQGALALGSTCRCLREALGSESIWQHALSQRFRPAYPDALP